LKLILQYFPNTPLDNISNSKSNGYYNDLLRNKPNHIELEDYKNDIPLLYVIRDDRPDLLFILFQFKSFTFNCLTQEQQQQIFHIPRSMIPQAVFREFSAKTLKKLPVSDRNRPESVRSSTQESGDRIRLPVLTGSGRNRINPVTGSVYRNAASIKSPEYHGTGRFRVGLFDMGLFIN
jgi:hypothetical protein